MLSFIAEDRQCTRLLFLQEGAEFWSVCFALFTVISEHLGSIIFSHLPFSSALFLSSTRRDGCAPAPLSHPSPLGRFHVQPPPQDFHLICFKM